MASRKSYFDRFHGEEAPNISSSNIVHLTPNPRELEESGHIFRNYDAPPDATQLSHVFKEKTDRTNLIATGHNRPAIHVDHSIAAGGAASIDYAAIPGGKRILRGQYEELMFNEPLVAISYSSGNPNVTKPGSGKRIVRAGINEGSHAGFRRKEDRELSGDASLLWRPSVKKVDEYDSVGGAGITSTMRNQVCNVFHVFIAEMLFSVIMGEQGVKLLGTAMPMVEIQLFRTTLIRHVPKSICPFFPPKDNSLISQARPEDNRGVQL